MMSVSKKSFKQVGLIVSCLLVCNGAFANNKTAIATFEANTLPIIEKADLIAKQQFALMDEINKLMAAGNLRQIFETHRVTKLQQYSNESIAQAKLLAEEYRVFISKLPETSSCYQPESLAEFQQLISEAEANNLALSELPANAQTSDDMTLTMAAMDLQMQAGQVGSLVPMFQLIKACYITDAMGMTKQDIERMNAEGDDGEF